MDSKMFDPSQDEQILCPIESGINMRNSNIHTCYQAHDAYSAEVGVTNTLLYPTGSRAAFTETNTSPYK